MALKVSRSSWALLVAGFAAAAAAPCARAWPTTSPSAKSAAHLKYHPPANWLQHYLPDDRYKIAGGVWKVVSTQYDTHYHNPDSQFMLHQPAGIVIGFASEAEAKAAGYVAGSGFRPSSPRVIRKQGAEPVRRTASNGNAGNATAVASSLGGSRVAGSAAQALNSTFSSARTSAAGMESAFIHTGPRGGKFHLSANGKKVYEKPGSSRTYAKRRR